MANEYLLKEYELCFEQLRFYDTRQENLLKYLCSLTSAVATAEFAVYELLHGGTAGFYGCEALLSGLIFVATALLLLAMLQNRLYFVFVARQLNAIRGYLMEVAADDFEKNQLYTSTDFPALKPLSVHTLQLLGATLVSSLFAGASAYGILMTSRYSHRIPITIGTIIVVLLIEAGLGILHLLRQGSADKVIHGRE